MLSSAYTNKGKKTAGSPGRFPLWVQRRVHVGCWARGILGECRQIYENISHNTSVRATWNTSLRTMHSQAPSLEILILLVLLGAVFVKCTQGTPRAPRSATPGRSTRAALRVTVARDPRIPKGGDREWGVSGRRE